MENMVFLPILIFFAVLSAVLIRLLSGMNIILNGKKMSIYYNSLMINAGLESRKLIWVSNVPCEGLSGLETIKYFWPGGREAIVWGISQSFTNLNLSRV